MDREGDHQPQTPRPLSVRALLLGCVLVVALAFLIPYFHLILRKYDWAFRPLPTGPMFILFVLVWPVNTLLQRLRPSWAFTGPELLLAYAMMAISGAIASEGLFGYVTVNSVYPQYYATPENRWGELFIPSTPLWLQVTSPEGVRWFFEGMPEGAAVPWRDWVPPIAAWSLFAFGLYTAFFCLTCLLRKDWIEGQRLTFPFAALPIEVAGDRVPSARSPFFRNPVVWIGFALPVLQSLLQMAHGMNPAIPYSPMYWHIGQWLPETGPWASIRNTYAYIGFETIGILALLPAEISLSLWLFFLADRTQLFTFSALGFGEESLSARVFSPSAFITYEEAGACMMLALILLWQSRRAIAAAFLRLVGRPAPSDPLDPIPPGAAALGLVLSLLFLHLWAYRTGMDLWVFVALITIFLGYSLAMARLVAAGGVYVPGVSMAPRDVLVGMAGGTSYSPRSLTMITYLQHTFMEQPKINFLHFAINDMKVVHAARIRGGGVALALLLAVVLMLLISPWVSITAAYNHGALLFDTWQYQDSGSYAFGELAAGLASPEGRSPFLLLGLLCGAAFMYLLTYLHTTFLWWGISPIGFIMGGTFGMNARIWTNAFLAWLFVVLLRRFGGLRLYIAFRPAFVGMAVGHFVMMGLRSIIDPMLGLHMHLSAWS